MPRPVEQAVHGSLVKVAILPLPDLPVPVPVPAPRRPRDHREPIGARRHIKRDVVIQLVLANAHPWTPLLRLSARAGEAAGKVLPHLMGDG